MAETDDFVDFDCEDWASSHTVVAYVVSIWCLSLTWEGASVTSLGYLLLASVTGVHVMQTDTVQQAYARSVGMLDCGDWAVKADVPVLAFVGMGYVVVVYLTSEGVIETTLQFVVQD